MPCPYGIMADSKHGSVAAKSKDLPKGGMWTFSDRNLANKRQTPCAMLVRGVS